MSEDNKAAHRRFFEAWNEGNPDALDEIMASDVVDHDPYNPHGAEGREGIKKFMSMYRAAFPDIHFDIEEQIAEGDLVATRWLGTGTHEGELMGLSPTHKHASVPGITIDRFEGGVIAETWTNWDTFGLMQAIGAIPEAQAAQA